MNIREAIKFLYSPQEMFGVTWSCKIGCIYAHTPRDTPPHDISGGLGTIWSAGYYSPVILYDCGGSRIGDVSIGKETILGTKGRVEREYSEAIAKVSNTIPAFMIFIDTRTVETLAAGCCPHMLREQEL